MSEPVDLASRWLGGTLMAASDESFGDKENLLKPEPPASTASQFGNRGEIVDGWETRRRRAPGHDWVLVRLGAPGVITSVDIDTSFFTGNFPESCHVEATGREGYPSPAVLVAASNEWVEIVPRSPLRGDTRNSFPVSDNRRFTHVRLSTFPDGGVARLRVFGHVMPDPRQLDGLTIDLASQEFGGAVVASSDSFYTSAQLLNRPEPARSMGEGWETRRRRGEGHDFVVFRLAFAGRVRQLMVDTAYFRYNATAEIEVFGSGDDSTDASSPDWTPLLGRTCLQPDTRHVFAVSSEQTVASVRLDAYPDGGISRIRVIGSIDAAARRAAGYRWFNALPETQAAECLRRAGLSEPLARAIAQQRPLSELPSVPSDDAGALRSMLEGS
jgi:allantoicase